MRDNRLTTVHGRSSPALCDFFTAHSPDFDRNVISAKRNYRRNAEENEEQWYITFIEKKERCREKVGEFETMKSGD
jgi:hypothetical protein